MKIITIIALASFSLFVIACATVSGQELVEAPPFLSLDAHADGTGLEMSLIVSPSANSSSYSMTISANSNLGAEPMLSMSFAVIPVNVSNNKWVEPNWDHIFTMKPVVKNNPNTGDEVTCGGGHTNPGDFPTDKLPIDGDDCTPTYTIPANPADNTPYDVTIVYTKPGGGVVTPVSGSTKSMWPKNWENPKTNTKAKNQMIKILVNQLGKAIHQDKNTKPPKNRATK